MSPFGLMKPYETKIYDPNFQFNETYINWKNIKEENKAKDKKDRKKNPINKYHMRNVYIEEGLNLKNFYKDFYSNSIPLIVKKGCAEWELYKSMNNESVSLNDFLNEMFKNE